MLLVDKNIKEYVKDNKLILEGFDEKNLNGVSYDLTIAAIIDMQGGNRTEYRLNPGETVFVKTAEKLAIPEDILGRIAEKNSRMRQGLKVDGPHYQPGHTTYAFLRVQNISVNAVTLKKTMAIAQIMFEQLKDVPDMPYSKQAGASFQNETEYRGLGNYKEEYEKQTERAVEKARDDMEKMSQRIYANVLTLMGILVAIFALLSINYQAFSNAELDAKYILAMNFSLALSIVIMLGTIFAFINKAKNEKFLRWYLIILGLLGIIMLVLFAIPGF